MQCKWLLLLLYDGWLLHFDQYIRAIMNPLIFVLNACDMYIVTIYINLEILVRRVHISFIAFWKWLWKRILMVRRVILHEQMHHKWIIPHKNWEYYQLILKYFISTSIIIDNEIFNNIELLLLFFFLFEIHETGIFFFYFSSRLVKIDVRDGV